MFAVILIVLLTNTSYALTYEDKPNVTAYIAGSNHLTRGYGVLNVVVYNPAERKKVDYFDEKESSFFSGREDTLFTAYNVVLRLEGNEYIEVKTPEQKIPALPPFKPIDLKFVVKVKDYAKEGKYNLTLNVSFDRIKDLAYLDTYAPQIVPVQKTVVDGNETTTYEYRTLVEDYKIRYEHVSYEIPLTVYVEEKPVKIEIVNVSTENMVGMSKGKITVWIKNVGEKEGKNAYIVLETPSGFTASALTRPTTTPVPMKIPSTVPPVASVPSMSSTSMQPPQPAYYIGDIRPGETAKAEFYVRINVKDEGNYTFKVKAIYLNEFNQIEESNSVPFGVHIAEAPSLIVKSVKSMVYVNSKGDVIVTVVPTSNLKDVSLYLSAKPPLSVLSAEYYLGNVEAGKEYRAVFKVQASDEAKPITYPAEIRMRYRSFGDYFESDPVSIGVKINPKMKFEVYGVPKIHAGSTEIVTFVIKNVGNFTVKEATARLTITDPFTSNDDTSYIGTLKPGESKEIKFKLSVDSDATPKMYGLNLEVKYKDLEDEWCISEPTKAVIEVIPPQPPYGIIAIAVITAIVSVVYYLRRSKR